MSKKPLDETFKGRSVSRTLIDVGDNNTILGICWEYMVTLTPVKFRNLDRGHTQGRPASTSKSYTFITARLINENKLIGPKL
ncbi:uncharacterized protein LDX57_008668 [Aspergillus melleus]|uniref:uncharacterized protein n=1 Tax=Aspergillus melleus TaxID=138277 RepID=UPI001E8E2B65|nr:uncharacterized protein LDX57_008668 [Aspergillus melleus]KAH8431007.1 hypothetical protein LDX57_008668 [Aspergillus melleus]